MTNTTTNESELLAVGDHVVLPDGEVGTVQTILGVGWVDVVQAHKTLGCGPWTYPTGMLVKVSQGWAEAAIAAGGGLMAPVPLTEVDPMEQYRAAEAVRDRLNDRIESVLSAVEQVVGRLDGRTVDEVLAFADRLSRSRDRAAARVCELRLLALQVEGVL